jgi:hypothetical protein
MTHQRLGDAASLSSLNPYFHYRMIGQGRSFLTSDVYLGCLDIRKVIQTSLAVLPLPLRKEKQL